MIIHAQRVRERIKVGQQYLPQGNINMEDADADGHPLRIGSERAEGERRTDGRGPAGAQAIENIRRR